MTDKETEKLIPCGICGGGCFLQASMENGRITHVTKARDTALMKGNICVKGAALKAYIDSPDRIRDPLRRTGAKGEGKFERITWDEAFKEIGERLAGAKETDGAKSAVFYSGHPKWYRYALAELAAEYGTPNYCTESSTCHTAPAIAHKLCYGVDTLPADMKNCRTLICWGANPAYSRVESLKDMLAVTQRGGNLVVIDPRKTPMTEKATLHLQLRPGTDGALALAMANVIISEKLCDDAFLEKYSHGFEEYKAYVAGFTPECAEEITGVPAALIAKAARLYATESPSAIHTTSCGFAHCVNGVQNYRAVYLLEALTGNYDVPGGNHGPAGKWLRLNGFPHDARARVDVENEFTAGKFPVWNALTDNECQAMGLDAALKTGKPYRIKNLIAFGMNHRMFPNPESWRASLVASEFFVDTDFFMTDTAKCADIVLPAQMPAEREYVYLFPGRRLRYMPKALASGACKNDVEIIQGICAALDLHGPLTGMRSFDEYMQWMLKDSGVTLEELKSSPDGLPARKWLDRSLESFKRGLNTPSGKVEFYSETMPRCSKNGEYAPLPEFQDYLALNPSKEAYPFILSAGPRKPQLFHSRTYRVPFLAKLEEHTLAAIHPDDAAMLGIRDGDAVELTSPRCKRRYRADVSPSVRRGEIFVVHDDAGEQDANELFDPDYLDPVSGFPGFRTYFCNIEKAGDRK